jgi:hypothetical protein
MSLPLCSSPTSILKKNLNHQSYGSEHSASHHIALYFKTPICQTLKTKVPQDDQCRHPAALFLKTYFCPSHVAAPRSARYIYQPVKQYCLCDNPDILCDLTKEAARLHMEVVLGVWENTCTRSKPTAICVGKPWSTKNARTLFTCLCVRFE